MPGLRTLFRILSEGTPEIGKTSSADPKQGVTAVNERQAENTHTLSQLRTIAIRSAVVSGAFSLIVAGLLLVNYLQIKVLDPVRAERLEFLKSRGAYLLY